MSLCNLRSFKGCPQVINGHFDCSKNQLTSLEGAPKKVNGDFDIFDNRKKFTKQDVRAVCDVKSFIATDVDVYDY